MDAIAEVRSFNRLVARQAGILNDRQIGRRPLGEHRVLFEIGADGATPRDVRIRLGLDSGYLARLLGSLQRAGLVEAAPNATDRRTKLLRLTKSGRAKLRQLDRAADEFAASVLAPLDADQRERLLRAQGEVRRLLAISMVTIEEVDVRCPDARWCLEHYFAELAERFEEGFDPGEWPVHRPDVFVIARIDRQPAGCGGLKDGEIVRMWVDAPHRGLGVATRILAALEQAAAARGHESVRLYTNRALPEAQAMYRKHGYAEIPRYCDDPYGNHFFEKRLTAAAAA
jgi:DNA-binding MarR family transcriptional regulator/GNAT superfamily N-acetyltransferase